MSAIPGIQATDWEVFSRALTRNGFQKILSREYQFCSLRQVYQVAVHRDRHLVLYANSEPLSGGFHLGHGCVFGTVRISENHLEAMGYLHDATDSYFIHEGDLASVCFGLPGYQGDPFDRLDELGGRYPFVPWRRRDTKLRMLDNLDTRLLKENHTYVTVDDINVEELRWYEFLDAAPAWVHAFIFGDRPPLQPRVMRKRPS